MSMIYQWRTDARFPVGATIAAERLTRIKKQNGEITPRAVVDDASSPKSPLLIGSIVVAEVNDKPVQHETRAFVHVTADSPRYEPIDVAMRSEPMREEIIGRAWQEIKSWRARYAAYQEFAEIIDAIDTNRRKRSV